MSLERSTGEGDELENVVDQIITEAIEAVVSLPERRKDVSLKTILSVRMSLDEGLGYLGGQRLAHEKPDLMTQVLDW